MSFQAYLDNIKIKTGKSPDDFKQLAQKEGLLRDDVKAGEVIAWLKKDFDLGHGHAMAIYTVFKGWKEQRADIDGMLEKNFSGSKSTWRPVFDFLLSKLKALGSDVTIDPAFSYISILRGGKKFAIVQASRQRLDIGIKLKSAEAAKRFEAAENWNALMTHRIRITDKKQIDKELPGWLKNALHSIVTK